MSPGAHRLLDQIRSRRSRAGVVGLGYVGLPLAMELARAGFDTTGIDVDQRKVEAVNRGTSYIPDVPTPELAALVAEGRLHGKRKADVAKSDDAGARPSRTNLIE